MVKIEYTQMDRTYLKLDQKYCEGLNGSKKPTVTQGVFPHKGLDARLYESSSSSLNADYNWIRQQSNLNLYKEKK